MSENRSFGSQAVRPKVGTSANSAPIRYYLPRLKLSIALFSRKRGNERLVISNYQVYTNMCVFSETSVMETTNQLALNDYNMMARYLWLSVYFK